MSKVIFNYNQIETEIQCEKDETMQQICARYATKIEKELISLIFMYSGKIIDLKLKFENVISDIDLKNEFFKVLVKSMDESVIIDNNIIKSCQSICPKCKEIALFEIKNYKIKLSCKNGDSTNILLSEYEATQKIDQSKIICDICKNNNKGNTFQSKFIRCNDCKKNICPLCVDNHDEYHNLINYDDKNFYCEEHSELFYSYCKSCKKNLCIECEKYHQKHETVNFGMLVPEKNTLKKNLEEYKKTKDNFNNNVKELIKKLNIVNDNIELLYKIYEDMVNNYIKLKSKRNYELIMNIIGFDTNIFIDELKQINDNKNNNIKYI